MAPVGVGCAGDTSNVEAGSDDVTDVAQSPVKRQSIGNCWVYATVGWVESLHLAQTGNELNLSESYVTYWDWFEKITGSRVRNNAVSTGGGFGAAAELIQRYGVMPEASFIPEEADAQLSQRQKKALEIVNRSLASGALSTPAARADRALVRAELDRAFGLSATVVATLDEVFGKDAVRNLRSTGASVPAESGLIQASKLAVGDDATGAIVTLADALGEQYASYDIDSRVGKHAWTEVRFPSYSASSRRKFYRRIQRAMHDKQPIIVSWFVDFNAMDSSGAFKAPPEKIGRQGGHMTILEDYEIENVPGFGTLKAGEEVTDPATLEAALATEAKIKFFRIKNSWGTAGSDPSGTGNFKGYHDLYVKYLEGPVARCLERAAEPANVTEDNRDCVDSVDEPGIWGVVLPPGY